MLPLVGVSRYRLAATDNASLTVRDCQWRRAVLIGQPWYFLVAVIEVGGWQGGLFCG